MVFIQSIKNTLHFNFVTIHALKCNLDNYFHTDDGIFCQFKYSTASVKLRLNSQSKSG